MNRKQKIGLYGEEMAEKFLIKKGYTVLEKRFQIRFGEIDLIIGKDDVVAFVEVKTRTTVQYGRPEESVNSHKIKKMRIVAKRYIQEKDITDKDFRLDCLAIELNVLEKKAKIRYYENIG